MRLILLGILLPLCAGENLCPPTQFWSNKLTVCVLCTKCKKNQVTLRPCLPHKDTLCGPISDLKIDWSWLPKEQSHHLEKDRIHMIPKQRDSVKINPKHHSDLELLDESILDSYTPKVNLLESDFIGHDSRKNSKNKLKAKPHHKHFEIPASDLEAEESTIRFEDYLAETVDKNKNHKKHFSFPSDKWESSEMDPESREHIRSENEKKLKKLYLKSQKQFNHRMSDLIKNLKEEHMTSSGEEGGIKLNHPIHKLDAKIYQDLLNHESHSNKTKKHKKPFSDFDLKIFKDLVNEERNRDLDFISVLSKSGAEGLDFKSVLPTHRMFLGEPSTISEIIGQVKESQDFPKEEKRKVNTDKMEKKGSFQEKKSSNNPNSAPFSAAENFVWDWQAVAFISAVTSCVLFVVAAVYTILNARQWRRVKIKYDTDLEEMSSKLALMPTSLETSVSDGNHTGHYLEQLLATQNLDERKGNIYINDKPSS